MLSSCGPYRTRLAFDPRRGRRRAGGGPVAGCRPACRRRPSPRRKWLGEDAFREFFNPFAVCYPGAQSRWYPTVSGEHAWIRPARRRGVVAELSESGMSNRAIADVIGVSDQTVNNDMNAGDKSWHLIARSLARTAKPTRHRKGPDPATPRSADTCAGNQGRRANGWLFKPRLMSSPADLASSARYSVTAEWASQVTLSSMWA